MLTPRITVGISLKMYFGHREAAAWCARVATIARSHPVVAAGEVGMFVVPSYLQIPAALSAFEGTGVLVGAQDVATADEGAYTGEVSAVELAEAGVQLAEVGHAERRRMFGETEEIVAAKTAAALRNGVTPLLCVGETERTEPDKAVRVVVEQLRRALTGSHDGSVVVAYEPVWAIGAHAPASVSHILTVVAAARTLLGEMPGRRGSSVIYGGSAGPGLLTRLGDGVDGLFLGRFAHDETNLSAVLDEAAALITNGAVS